MSILLRKFTVAVGALIVTLSGCNGPQSAHEAFSIYEISIKTIAERQEIIHLVDELASQDGLELVPDVENSNKDGSGSEPPANTAFQTNFRRNMDGGPPEISIVWIPIDNTRAWILFRNERNNGQAKSLRDAIVGKLIERWPETEEGVVLDDDIDIDLDD